MRTIACLIAWLFLLPVTGRLQTVTDYDGNLYDTVMIGTMAWLKQNLKVTHYRNGDPIPHVAGSTAWASLTSGARCYYNNDSAAFDSLYGTLYNWYAVNNTKGLCPDGWHVPSDAEWTVTENDLGGSMIAGGKMKEAGTLHWLAPNTGATNSSGFTGLPGGMLSTTFLFETMFENGLWWTSTWQSPGGAWSRYLWYLFAGVDRNPTPKTIALSVRCVKDPAVGMGETGRQGVRLQPNPARHRVTVVWEESLEFNLTIFNTLGQPVLVMVNLKRMEPVDLSPLVPGIYLVNLSAGSRTAWARLIKE